MMMMMMMAMMTMMSNLGFLEGKAKLLAGKPHRGGVDDGHQLLGVLRQQLVEELLVPLQQLDHVHVLVERVLQATEVLHAVVGLLVLALHPGHTGTLEDDLCQEGRGWQEAGGTWGAGGRGCL